MSTTPGPSVPATEHLIRWIECSGESDNIDAKGPMKWDGQANSAALAKDIAAFCNSLDGGVIVVGKREKAPGDFENTGLTPEEADSFETTRVANWLNSRFSPPIRLACYRQDHLGKTFLVITVEQFDDIPAFCVKSFQDPKDNRNHILREGAIYVRNQNAESKPVGTVDEWRALIGLATKQRGDDFLAMFNAMLKGKPLVPQPSDEEQLQRELSQVWEDLGLAQSQKQTLGAWWMSFSPGTYNPRRWSEPEMLEEAIRKHSVRVYHGFPAYHQGTIGMGWGIASERHGETWAMTYSGLFVFHKEFYENREVGKGPYVGDEETPPGQWVAYQWSMSTFIEFFMFMARFTDAYEPGESVLYELVAAPLQGKKLLSVSPSVRVAIGEPQPCRAKEYRYQGKVAVEELRTAWEDYCAKAMREFYLLFPSEERIRVETLREWVESFKERRF